MKILAINCGSSTLKFQLVETSPTVPGRERRLARGTVDRKRRRISEEDSRVYAYIIPVDEAVIIARDTVDLLCEQMSGFPAQSNQTPSVEDRR